MKLSAPFDVSPGDSDLECILTARRPASFRSQLTLFFADPRRGLGQLVFTVHGTAIEAPKD